MKSLIILVLGAVFFSCESEVNPKNVIFLKAKRSELAADGASRTKIIGYIPIEALPDKRIITFKTYRGTLEDSLADAQVKKISLKADILDGDYWTASTYYQAGVDAGETIVYASIEGIVDSVVISLLPAPAIKISLTADGFAVPVNFLGELNLSAALSSKMGKATRGQQVRFIDSYEDGSPVEGSFRNTVAKSDDNSIAKTIYSPGPVSPNTYVYITATVLDDGGDETDISQTIKIFLKPE